MLNKITTRATERVIKRMTIIGGVFLLVGYTLNFYGLMKIYKVIATCKYDTCQTKSEDTIITIGSALIYTGLAIMALIAGLLVCHFIQRRRQKNQSIKPDSPVKAKITKKKAPTK